MHHQKEAICEVPSQINLGTRDPGGWAGSEIGCRPSPSSEREVAWLAGLNQRRRPARVAPACVPRAFHCQREGLDAGLPGEINTSLAMPLKTHRWGGIVECYH